MNPNIECLENIALNNSSNSHDGRNSPGFTSHYHCLSSFEGNGTVFRIDNDEVESSTSNDISSDCRRDHRPSAQCGLPFLESFAQEIPFKHLKEPLRVRKL